VSQIRSQTKKAIRVLRMSTDCVQCPSPNLGGVIPKCMRMFRPGDISSPEDIVTKIYRRWTVIGTHRLGRIVRVPEKRQLWGEPHL
jgi:hypothetical protein